MNPQSHQKSRTWQLAHGRSLELSHQSRLMGILNVTPDSFSDGGKFTSVSNAIDQAAKMIDQGADIVDIGGESTRPGAKKISSEQEQARILPIITALNERFDTILSIDTYHSDTAKCAIKAGAHIINDIWGLQYDKEMAQVVSSTRAGVCMMHNSRGGCPIGNLLENQLQFLNKSISIAKDSKITSDQIVIDPGLGFGKNAEENLFFIDNLSHLRKLSLPILFGSSRKRFTSINLKHADSDTNRDIVTSATNVIARMAGCAIFRVHDIEINKMALMMADAVLNSRK